MGILFRTSLQAPSWIGKGVHESGDLVRSQASIVIGIGIARTVYDKVICSGMERRVDADAHCVGWVIDPEQVLRRIIQGYFDIEVRTLYWYSGLR